MRILEGQVNEKKVEKSRKCHYSQESEEQKIEHIRDQRELWVCVNGKVAAKYMKTTLYNHCS